MNWELFYAANCLIYVSKTVLAHQLLTDVKFSFTESKNFHKFAVLIKNQLL